MIYFTSDTHFGHENVIRFAGRPYETVAQMNRALVVNINARVLPRDELYILGDFSFRITVEDAKAIREQIRCERVRLIPGNHDKDWGSKGLAGTFDVMPPISRLKPGDFIALAARVIPWISKVPGDNEVIIRIEGLAHRRIPVIELLHVASTVDIARYKDGHPAPFPFAGCLSGSLSSSSTSRDRAMSRAGPGLGATQLCQRAMPAFSMPANHASISSIETGLSPFASMPTS